MSFNVNKAEKGIWITYGMLLMIGVVGIFGPYSVVGGFMLIALIVSLVVLGIQRLQRQ